MDVYKLVVSSKGSRMKKFRHILAPVPPKRLEAFLIAAANTQTDSIRRLAKQFADFGPFDAKLDQALMRQGMELYDDGEEPEEGAVEFAACFHVGLLVEALWLEEDVRTRDWAFAVLRINLSRSINPEFTRLCNFDDESFGLIQPPPPTPIEQAVAYLLKHHNRARLCDWWDCPTRFFLAGRHTQRYCSEKCAQLGERQAKRNWWAKHGEEWRAKTKGKKLARKRPSAGGKRKMNS